MNAEWYASILNSQVEYENPQYAFAHGAGTILGFYPADSKNSVGTNGSVAYFEVDDLAEATTKLTSMGATLYRGPIKTDLGANVAMLKDPFGNAIGLSESSPI